MKIARIYSQLTKHAMALLGKQIKLYRKQRKWTEQELAGRAGFSRATLKKIEKGDLRCEIGLVFEAATLVGIRLFDEDHSGLISQIDRVQDKIALLPKTIRKNKQKVDDDF